MATMANGRVSPEIKSGTLSVLNNLDRYCNQHCGIPEKVDFEKKSAKDKKA